MKTKPTNIVIVWLPDVADGNYPAAESYLRLIYDDRRSSQLVNKLRRASIVEFKSKDIFRASRLSLLGISNARVKRDQGKILSGKKLSPLLLVRDTNNGKVVIADGYRRMCAVYSFGEDAPIPCKIIDDSTNVSHGGPRN